MASAEITDEEDPPKKGGKLGLIIGLVAALAAAGGGFFVTYSGMLSSGPEQEPTAEEVALEEIEKAASGSAYIALDPLIVSIRSSSQFKLLRFTGQLEVDPSNQQTVEDLKPRIVDVMNTYLNALEASTFEDPIAMIRLRSQLLRRVQLVTGVGLVNNLLIMEFVLQ